MGEVYLADDEQLGRRVALKFLPQETGSDVVAQRRLLREARSAAALDHPHICSVYEVGETDGRPYIAMQYVDGEALDARLRRGPLDLNEVLTIAVHVADALNDAHAHGILHRDIKPANIMITSRGDAKVMDFGLAKSASTDGRDERAETVSVLTHQGAVVGTAAYMSPEQARGEPLDPRSDLFSVGVLLYEMTSGQRPFKGASSAELAAAILTYQPPPLARFAPTTPSELERIVAKLLNKRPDNRYQTAKDLLIDLRTLKDDQEFQVRLERTPQPGGQITSTRPPEPIPPAQDRTAPSPILSSVSPPRRSSRLVVVGLIALLVVSTGGWFLRRAAQQRWANAQLAQVTALAEAGRYAEAYDLVAAVEAYLPGNSTLTALMPTISDTLSVTTEPPGASVY